MTGFHGAAASGSGEHDVEVVREAVTMALYVSLSLLAVVLATPRESLESRSALAATVFLTTLGLLLAHQIAFAISSRLVSHGRLESGERRVIGAQLLGGLGVAVMATIPLLLLDPPLSLQVAELLMLATVVGVSYVAARQAEVERHRALVYAGFVLVLVGLLMVVKAATHH